MTPTTLTSPLSVLRPLLGAAGIAAALLFVANPAAAQLALDDAQLLTQGIDGMPGSSAVDDAFGAGLAVGDFDGDGRHDLAVGAPGKVVSDIVGAGQVTVIYGAAAQLDPTTGTQFALEDTAFPQAYLDSAFGYALAAADFDADGFDDLAIGVPGHYYLPLGGGGSFESGAVVVLYGSAVGLDSAGQQIFREGVDGMVGSHQNQDHFGQVLAVGDFNDDGYADLAVGVPGQEVGGHADSGVVVIIYGSAAGLSAQVANEDPQTLTQGLFGLDPNGADEHFGTSLAVGDFDDDGIDDLAIGTPDDEVMGAPSAGSVTVAYGSATGITTTGAQRLSEAGDTPGIFAALDHFGAALAAGDLDCDGIDDLAIGIPDQDFISGAVTLATDVGGVLILRGTATGVSTTEGYTLDRSVVSGLQVGADHFGSALAIGRFDLDACEDLVVGVPGSSVARQSDAGVAFVFAGTPGAAPAHVLTASQDGSVPESPELDDHFGSHLAVGDFRGDGLDDLVVGVPDDSASGQQDAGRVNVFYSDGRIFDDGFESGDTAAWSATVGG